MSFDLSNNFITGLTNFSFCDQQNVCATFCMRENTFLAKRYTIQILKQVYHCNDACISVALVWSCTTIIFFCLLLLCLWTWWSLQKSLL